MNQQVLVINRVRFMTLGVPGQDTQVSLRGVAESVRFDREFVDTATFDDLVTGQPAAGFKDIGDETGDQVFGTLPVHLLGQFFAGGRVNDRVVDDDQHTRGDDYRWFRAGGL